MKQVYINFILNYIRWWAKLALRLNSPSVIGIAGSAGKSSCKKAVYAALKDHFNVKVLDGNSETGVPLSILGIHPRGYSKKDWLFTLARVPFGLFFLRGTDYAIIEMGIDDPLPPKNMAYLLTIVKPDIAISLNISATHTEQFEKILPRKRSFNAKDKLEYILQAMASEDTRIITDSGCETAIANADDSYIMEALQEYTKLETSKTYTFGAEGTLSYTDWKIHGTSTTFEFSLNFGEESKTISLQLENMLLPQVYQETFAAAILAALSTELSITDIITGIQKHFRLPSSRSTLFHGINNGIIIDSSYNASKKPVLTSLALAKKIAEEQQRPFVLLFGDMRELGESAAIEHDEVARAIAKNADHCYCVGDISKEVVMPILHERMENAQWFAHAEELGAFLKDNLPEKAVVLAKGSQNTIFLEEALKPILQNTEDMNDLTRQSPYWIRTKKKYFTSRQQELQENR